MPHPRRAFLWTAGGAVFAQAPPSDRVRLGVIGSGGRGTFVMTVFQKDASVRVRAVCDVYEPNLERAISTARKQQSDAPKLYRNYKELLADKEIDAVLIATPEHWHHRMVLDALAAGKDVYVEKPLCQTPEQGVELVDAEKRSRNIVQVGMQRRSYDLYLEGRKTVASGVLGAVRMVRSWWLNNYLAVPLPSLTALSTGNSGRVLPRAARSIRTVFATGASSPTTPAASSPTRVRMSLMASTCS
jgi:predicted dehydrogenase